MFIFVAEVFYSILVSIPGRHGGGAAAQEAGAKAEGGQRATSSGASCMEFLLSRTPPRCCVLQDMFGMYGSSLFEFPIVLKTPDLVVAVLLRCQ